MRRARRPCRPRPRGLRQQGGRRPCTATTEGIYIDVGDLKYQVQISRLLNPTDREDSGYLVDLPADQQLRPEENWFAVFMRVENTSDKPEPAANGYSDPATPQGNIYRADRDGAEATSSPTARPSCSRRTVLPSADSPAGANTIQGAMLLFKIPVAELPEPPAGAPDPPPDGSGADGHRRPRRLDGRLARRRRRATVIEAPRPGLTPRYFVAFSPARSTCAPPAPRCRRRRPSATSSTPTATWGRPLPAGA